MPSVEYKFNSFREKKVRDKYLLTTYNGDWIALDKNEYIKLKTKNIDDNLFQKLEEKSMIVTTNNKNKIIEKYKKKKPQLFQGTSLHIVVVTLRCNEQCVYCHAASAPVNRKELDMSLETAKKTVDFIFQSPSDAITIEFQGGEPLLNYSVIKETIKYAREKNKKIKKDLRFTVVTNLSLMTDDIYKFFLEQDVLGLCTSLDGPKHIHDHNRPMVGGSSYDLTVKWIKKIKADKRIDLNGLMSTTRHSLPYAKEIVDEYRKLGFKRLWFRMLNNLGAATAQWKKISYTPEDYLTFWKQGIDYVFSKEDIVELSSNIILRKILTDKDPMYIDLMSPCGAAIAQMAYHYNGDIYSCDEARMLKDDLFRLGNVFENTYNEVLTSPKTCNLISASVNDTYMCNSCSFQPYCGLCPVCNYAYTGNLVPNLSTDFRCKVLMGQFNYLFDKIICDPTFKPIIKQRTRKLIR